MPRAPLWGVCPNGIAIGRNDESDPHDRPTAGCEVGVQDRVYTRSHDSNSRVN